MSDRRRPRWARRPLAALAGLLAVAALAALPGTGQAAATATFSTADLTAASDAVLAADIGGTAWAIDQDAGTVRVSADETVTDEEIADLRQRAGTLSSALTIERIPGTLRPHLQAGEAIYSGGWRCTAGLNVRSADTYYFLTAGHCTEGASTWFADASLTTSIGPTAGTSFPGNDYGLVRYANPSVPHPGTVVCDGAVIDIVGVTNPRVGMTASFAGASSGCHTGTISGLNHTVNYGGDVVYGLIRTSHCTLPGDSGGLLFSSNLAVGLLSGGSGSCTTGGTSFFQPVAEALSAYGLSVY